LVNNLKEYEKAIRDYNKTLEIDPKFALPYNGRCNAYLGLKEYGNAIVDYNKALELDPKFTEAYDSRRTAIGIYLSILKSINRFK